MSSSLDMSGSCFVSFAFNISHGYLGSPLELLLLMSARYWAIDAWMMLETRWLSPLPGPLSLVVSLIPVGHLTY